MAETIVLDIIESNQPVSGYQIRKIFTETTDKRLSFGTLVPMLHRFERDGLVIRTRAGNDESANSYSWFLTPMGKRQLDSRLSLLVKMLKASTIRRVSGLTTFEKEAEILTSEESSVLEKPPEIVTPKFVW